MALHFMVHKGKRMTFARALATLCSQIENMDDLVLFCECFGGLLEYGNHDVLH